MESTAATNEGSDGTLAQEPDSTEPGASELRPAHDAESSDLSDEKIHSFARAYLQVVRIEQQYSAQAQTATSPTEVEALQIEAQRDMEQAIVQEGLTVTEFEQIGQVVASNEDLRQRVEDEVRELQVEDG